MREYQIQKCIEGALNILRVKGYLIIYGPFKYRGQYTSPADKKFDNYLKQNNPQMVSEILNGLFGRKNGFGLIRDICMPTENQTLIFKLKILKIMILNLTFSQFFVGDNLKLEKFIENFPS